MVLTKVGPGRLPSNIISPTLSRPKMPKDLKINSIHLYLSKVPRNAKDTLVLNLIGG